MASFFKGTPGGFQSVSAFNPQIQGGLNQGIMQLLQQLLGGGMGQDFIQQMQDQANQNYQQNIVPSIAERFTSMGEGAQSSGAFQGALGSAGANMSRDIALQGGMYNQGQQQNLLNMLLGLGRMENAYKPREASGFESLIPKLAEAGGRAAGAYFSGGLSEGLPLLTSLLGQ